eukprot:g15604.t1
MSVITFFGHMSLTSIGFGALIGLLAVAMIGKCAEERFHSDSLIQVITTLCCAYLAFFLGESELATSGVLATVSAGFMVAYFAWPRFVSAEAMEIVWETVEFVGNTVIFFLAGLLFADTLLDSVGWLLVLYVALLLIRTIMLGVLWIPLHWVGNPIDWREGIAMIWSGLRGYTREDSSNDRSSNADQRKLAVLTKHLADHTQEIKGQLDPADVRFKGIDEAMLRAMVPSLAEHVKVAEELGSDESSQAYREAFLQVVKSHYWSSIHQGLLPRTSQSARLLLSSVDVALDTAAELLGLFTWEVSKCFVAFCDFCIA